MVKQVKERKVEDTSKAKHVFKYPEVGVPFLWPFSFFIGLEEEGLEDLRDDLKYLKEVEKTQVEKPKPTWATKNKVKLDLKTLNLTPIFADSLTIIIEYYLNPHIL
jgi:hypothetical protein